MSGISWHENVKKELALGTGTFFMPASKNGK
jgi:hypothetical protein